MENPHRILSRILRRTPVCPGISVLRNRKRHDQVPARSTNPLPPHHQNRKVSSEGKSCVDENEELRDVILSFFCKSSLCCRGAQHSLHFLLQEVEQTGRSYVHALFMLLKVE